MPLLCIIYFVGSSILLKYPFVLYENVYKYKYSILLLCQKIEAICLEEILYFVRQFIELQTTMSLI